MLTTSQQITMVQMNGLKFFPFRITTLSLSLSLCLSLSFSHGYDGNIFDPLYMQTHTLFRYNVSRLKWKKKRNSLAPRTVKKTEVSTDEHKPGCPINILFFFFSCFPKKPSRPVPNPYLLFSSRKCNKAKAKTKKKEKKYKPNTLLPPPAPPSASQPEAHDRTIYMSLYHEPALETLVIKGTSEY